MDPDDRPAHLPLAGLTEPAEADGASTTRLGVVALFVDTLRRPSSAMTRLAAHPDRRWLAPLVLLLLVAVAEVAVVMPAVRAEQGAAIEASLATSPQSAEGQASEQAVMAASGLVDTVTVVGGLVAAVAGTVVAVLVAAAILHLMGTVVGGQQTFGQVLTVTTWARLPLAIGGVMWIAYVLAGNWDPNPSGLAGLVAPAPGDVGAQRSYLEPLLAQIELWNLWYLGLLVVAVRATSRVSRAKAAMVVAILVGLKLAMGFVGVAVVRAMSGLMG